MLLVTIRRGRHFRIQTHKLAHVYGCAMMFHPLLFTFSCDFYVYFFVQCCITSTVSTSIDATAAAAAAAAIFYVRDTFLGAIFSEWYTHTWANDPRWGGQEVKDSKMQRQ